MRHFSCDVCGKSLADDDTAARYVVRVEAYPAADAPDHADAGLDADHIADMADLLAELGAGDPTDAPLGGLTEVYDLCPSCYGRFLADPLGRDRRRVRFSPN